MSKREYPKGTIIRRKAAGSNLPYGPYLEVTKSTKHHVYAKNLFGEDQIIVDRDNVYVPTIKQLCVSESKIIDLFSGGSCVSHPRTKAWERVLDNEPELVMFYTTKGWYKAWCTVDYVREYYSSSLREYLVFVYISNVIKKEPHV